MDELILLLEEKVSLLKEKDAQITGLSRVVQQLTEQNEKLKCINDCLLTRKATATCLESCAVDSSPTLPAPLDLP